MDNLQTLDLDSLILGEGSHAAREKGVCLMEAVAWFANEPHSDRPQCASPVLTSFGIALNDSFPADQRQKLKACIPLLVGTRNAELEQQRIYFLANKAVKVFAPIALRAAASALPEKLKEHADKLNLEAGKLEALADFSDPTAARAAAARAAYAAAYAADAADAADAARAAYAAARAADAAARAAYAAAYAADAAAYAAARAADAAADAAARAAAEVYDKAIEVFKEAIAIR